MNNFPKKIISLIVILYGLSVTGQPPKLSLEELKKKVPAEIIRTTQYQPSALVVTEAKKNNVDITYIKDQLQKADELFENDDYNESYKIYNRYKKYLDVWQQYYLGFMYDNGYGVSRDYVEAVKWYRKTADQGDANGQGALGCMYENGKGLTKNYTEAAKWYRKAADQDDAYGQSHLGNMYYYGYGVVEDYSEAAIWYHKAAEQGDTYGQYSLGYMYENGQGVIKSRNEALKWYKKAAENDNEEAKKRLKELENN